MVSNIHTHSTFCDGENSLEEMAQAALDAGFTDLGYSPHSYAPFDESCLGCKDTKAYFIEVDRLRKKYLGRLTFGCGTEQDYYAPVERVSYDYIIGSVHYIKTSDDIYHSVDNTPEIAQNLVDNYYAGNWYKMAEAYYSLNVLNVEKYLPEVVGHYDLVARFNGDGSFFDESCAEYQNIALLAIESMIDKMRCYGGIIECNTGAMVRGRRRVPYPAPFLLKFMAEKNARVIITTDSHSISTINSGFSTGLEFLRGAGFKSMVVLQEGVFKDVKI